MTEHYTNDTVNCGTYHTVDEALFKTKDALKDAVDCNVPVKCIWCGLLASAIPQLQVATFGLPPLWYVRVGVNLQGSIYVTETKKKRAQR